MKNRTAALPGYVAGLLALTLAPSTAGAEPELLIGGLLGPVGSTVGPDGALYVPESAVGRIARIDLETGAVTVFAEGLPATLPWVGFGGAVDVAFLDGTAYALVTMVGPDVGGSHVAGIYRVDGPDSVTPVADIGTFAIGHPPATPYEVPTGVQYALEPFRGGFLVTDGHHNRVLRVTLDGEVSEMIAFGNIVPTGLEVIGNTVYMAQSGAAPHLPAEGKVVAFGPKSSSATDVAAGAPLLVDVERGTGRTMFALAQGTWNGAFPGSPALPGTGSLVRLDGAGGFGVVADGLTLPSSLEIVGNRAYVITLVGDVWSIDGVAGPPFGMQR
jgi:sugar lactone lactonase YvrE